MNTAYKQFSVNYDTADLANSAFSLRKQGGQNCNLALLIMQMLAPEYPELQAELGYCYYREKGVKQNTEKAISLLRAAADKGSVRARYDLGWYYYEHKEYMRAIESFAVCVAQGDKLTEEQLGNAYACLGDGYTKISEPKLSTAIDNLAIAADKYRDGFACRRLGQLYEQDGVHHFDPVKAVKYYELGASCGDGVSAAILGMMYIYGEEKLNIVADGSKAEAILLPRAEENDYEVLRALGVLYKRGDDKHGVPANYQRARTFFEQAWALRQSPRIAAELGYVYYRLNEYALAEKMLLKADAEGCCDYSDFLGRMFREGELGQKDLEKAAYYYGRANDRSTLNNMFTCVEYAEVLEAKGDYQRAYSVAEAGLEKYNDVEFAFIKAKLVHSGKVTDRISRDEAAKELEVCVRMDVHRQEALMILGRYYMAAREYRKAEKNYMDAFALGVADAAVFLGRLYEQGGGTINPDVNKAYAHYLKAANAGSMLGKMEVACFKKGLFGGYKRIRSL